MLKVFLVTRQHVHNTNDKVAEKLALLLIPAKIEAICML
jgi:hypothetical protein